VDFRPRPRDRRHCRDYRHYRDCRLVATTAPQGGADIPVCAGRQECLPHIALPPFRSFAPALPLPKRSTPIDHSRPPSTPVEAGCRWHRHFDDNRGLLSTVSPLPTATAYRHCLLPTATAYRHCLPPLPTATAYCLLPLPTATPLPPVPSFLASLASWRFKLPAALPKTIMRTSETNYKSKIPCHFLRVISSWIGDNAACLNGGA
jgi:hypothetical protein